MLRNERLHKVLIYCCALVPAFLSIAWIHTFGFTDYRHHLAYIGLPLGIAMGALSVGMILLKRWAVVISVALTIISTVASIAIFFFCSRLHLCLLINTLSSSNEQFVDRVDQRETRQMPLGCASLNPT
jgi:hypothetical protein